jgi:hypothetical protein
MSKLKLAVIIAVGVVSLGLNCLWGGDHSLDGIITISAEKTSPESVFERNKGVADNWVNGLVEYECKDCPPLYKRLDDNGKYSYGCLQYQKDTFISDVKNYKLLPYTEDQEIMNFIYDCEFQKDLASVTILDNPKNAVRWRTSVEDRGYGYPKFFE